MPLRNLPKPALFLAVLSLALLVGLIDFYTGFYVSVFAFYALPIIVGVRLLGSRWGFAIFVVTAMASVTARATMHDAPRIQTAVFLWNMLMRVTTLFFFYIGSAAVHFRFDTMKARLRVLTGLLPVCSGCKRIRDQYGFWDDLETYLHENTEADVEHKLCPDCSKRLNATPGTLHPMPSSVPKP